MRFSLPVVAACALALASCSSSDDNGGTSSAKGTFTFIATDAGTNVRTSFDHTLGTGAAFSWESGDKIFVSDDTNAFQGSTGSTITGKTTTATFYVNGTFGGSSSYSVRYTGTNSTSASYVTIASAQTQSAANNTEHLGTSGDCGVATATSNGNSTYKFTRLEHKAAYLCFLPTATASTASSDYTITSIKVTAPSNIAGKFGFTDSGITSTEVTDGSTSITLSLTGGFPISNTSINQSLNAAYMVMLPGTYSGVTIVYTLYNSSTGATTTTSRTISSLVVSANEISRIQHILALS